MRRKPSTHNVFGQRTLQNGLDAIWDEVSTGVGEIDELPAGIDEI